ncbi:hypothetical protein BGX28_006996 [Mortierella sp. GBA30]|nr:hypothetical protein BGX28_006996 [Mortierella sp. GBA30]
MDLLLGDIQGKFIRRGDEGYPASVYQYSWSSYKENGIINPAVIIYANGDEDVQKVIKYAGDNDLGVAIRTGGHHFTGASSTYGENIQLDLSKTYTNFQWEEDDSQVTVGISISLSKLGARLREKGRFVPVGQCSHVHLGGHVQSGGYGQLIRAFGLLSDCVQKLRIITADGKIRWIERGVPEDSDLLFAFLGGSPGNFGVLTEVTLNLFKDEDYPKSRGIRARLLYTPERLKRLLDVVVEQDDKDDTPADYDYCVSFGSGREADGRPQGIVVWVQWANLDGEGQSYDSTFFDKIRKASGYDLPEKEAPISELCSQWLFNIAREFQLPYHKRCYFSKSRSLDLKESRCTEWIVNRINEIENNPSYNCYLTSQFQYSGGLHARQLRYANEYVSSLSWRDTVFGLIMDIFYDGEGAPAAKARQWAEQNDKEAIGHSDAKFAVDTRRMLWGSNDLDLPAVRKYYYDDHPRKYNRLSAIKQNVDPKHVFTANRFSIGPHPDRFDNPIPASLDVALKDSDMLAVTVDHAIEP